MTYQLRHALRRSKDVAALPDTHLLVLGHSHIRWDTFPATVLARSFAFEVAWLPAPAGAFRRIHRDRRH